MSTVNELTIGKHATLPDTYTAAYDDGTRGPHRSRRRDAERDYTDANTATGDVRTAIEKYGRTSKVFRAWSTIHPDFRSNYRDERHCLALDSISGATVLVRWLGPDALPQ
jgi:hypothetical protein